MPCANPVLPRRRSTEYGAAVAGNRHMRSACSSDARLRRRAACAPTAVVARGEPQSGGPRKGAGRSAVIANEVQVADDLALVPLAFKRLECGHDS